jgi:hypothetical protein
MGTQEYVLQDIFGCGWISNPALNKTLQLGAIVLPDLCGGMGHGCRVYKDS